MAAQGTSIHSAADDLALLENWPIERAEVESVTTTVGGAMTRFLLTYTPEDPNPAYGQIVIRMADHAQIPTLRDALAEHAIRTVPWAETRVQQIIYGPPVGADVEVRLSGPDPKVLRGLAADAQRIFETETDLLAVERTDWREPEPVTQPPFAAERA